MISDWRPCAGHHLNATSDDQLGRQVLHRLVSLIARQASHSRDSTIWSGLRRSNLQDFTSAGGAHKSLHTLGLREVVSSRRSDSDKRCEHSGKRVHGADEIMAIAAKAARRAVAGRLVEHL
jgi:hypothetical protein